MKNAIVILSVVAVIAATVIIGASADRAVSVERVRSSSPSPSPPPSIVGNVRTGIYHRVDCEWAGKIGADNLMMFFRAAEADSLGLRSCRVCRP